MKAANQLVLQYLVPARPFKLSHSNCTLENCWDFVPLSPMEARCGPQWPEAPEPQKHSSSVQFVRTWKSTSCVDLLRSERFWNWNVLAPGAQSPFLNLESSDFQVEEAVDLQRFSPGQALPFTSGGRCCSESLLAVARENMEKEENSFDLYISMRCRGNITMI